MLENLAWDIWLARNGLSFLSLTYEELLANPRASLVKVAHLVDAEITFESTSGPNSGLEIQRDTVNTEWRERFLSQYSDTSKFQARNHRGSGFL
ncbi:Stf0 sulfotransferase [Mesorhizobium loti]|uniref:Stf0 sulfotransferase n=2 Tax=Rhizobium loti TaxID=381 RepID=A0A8E2W921_RHILI|nr:Stf0 sulfotransferase [Mesorhizobium loti]